MKKLLIALAIVALLWGAAGAEKNRFDVVTPTKRIIEIAEVYDPCKPEQSRPCPDISVAEVLSLPGVWAFYAYNTTGKKWVVEICVRGGKKAVGACKNWQGALELALRQYRCVTRGE